MNTRSELIDIAKAMYAAFARRELDAIARLANSSCIWEAPGAAVCMPWVGVHSGDSGMRDFIGQLDKCLIFNSFNAETFYADDRAQAVFVRGLANCTVRSTGRTYTNNFAHFIQLSGGLICHFREYPDTLWQMVASYPAIIPQLTESL
jgi:uncharacterized protein